MVLFSVVANRHLEVVLYLVDAGADTTSAADAGSLPLQEAAYEGHTEMVQKLISAGSISDRLAIKTSKIALNITVSRGHVHTTCVLLVGRSMDVTDDNGCAQFVSTEGCGLRIIS